MRSSCMLTELFCIFFLIITHSYKVFSYDENLRFTLSKFQMYSKILLTVVTMLYIMSL